jgi:hypothetical protein
MIALLPIAPGIESELSLFVRLNPFDDDGRIQRARERDQVLQRRALPVAIQASPQEQAIDFHNVGREGQQLPDRSEASPEIIERDSATKPPKT